MVSTIEELDEMRARTMCDALYPNLGWVYLTDQTQEDFRTACRAIREADERAGLVTVPKEPTREMWSESGTAVIRAGQRHHDIISDAVYSAMISASPFAKKEE